ncbi:hypothetical protein EW146_g7767 [Bondarzewia mesenterica]|uniref:Uncharacterized protein n=1 Tax=Bondarzewia mesenterica TaxID=1095465 RepID=A0A4S4LQ97_9AGAM|nr:hypothetical protein EW146_g7767 [Bondarzewia mesenterica]
MRRHARPLSGRAEGAIQHFPIEGEGAGVDYQQEPLRGGGTACREAWRGRRVGGGAQRVDWNKREDAGDLPVVFDIRQNTDESEKIISLSEGAYEDLVAVEDAPDRDGEVA